MDDIVKILNDAGYKTIEGAEAVLEAINGPKKCSQCGEWEGLKFPRNDTPYCEDCGWPDEDFSA